MRRLGRGTDADALDALREFGRRAGAQARRDHFESRTRGPRSPVAGKLSGALKLLLAEKRKEALVQLLENRPADVPAALEALADAAGSNPSYAWDLAYVSGEELAQSKEFICLLDVLGEGPALLLPRAGFVPPPASSPLRVVLESAFSLATGAGREFAAASGWSPDPALEALLQWLCFKEVQRTLAAHWAPPTAADDEEEEEAAAAPVSPALAAVAPGSPSFSRSSLSIGPTASLTPAAAAPAAAAPAAGFGVWGWALLAASAVVAVAAVAYVRIARNNRKQ